MATSRQLRRLAFQALYQLDIHGGDQDKAVAAWVAEQDEDYKQAERDQALALALAAYDRRAQADAQIKALAPTWPPDRQPAVDRAILRLAHYEITRPDAAKPLVALNDAVELAKEYSTDKSPRFINGVLDRILKAAGAPTPAPPPQGQ